mgnify:CR=1 FL=1
MICEVYGNFIRRTDANRVSYIIPLIVLLMSQLHKDFNNFAKKMHSSFYRCSNILIKVKMSMLTHPEHLVNTFTPLCIKTMSLFTMFEHLS